MTGMNEEARVWRLGQAGSRVTEAANLLRPVALDDDGPPEDRGAVWDLVEQLEGIGARVDALRRAG